MGFETQDVERKVISIMKVLGASQEPLGARVIAQLLTEHGVELGERAVRYHLKMMDEKGLTRLIGQRDGRVLTEEGMNELVEARVKDKIGFSISKIESLSFRTKFDVKNKTGLVPVNVSFFSKDIFPAAVKLMEPAFKAGLCVSNLVIVATEGKRLGDFIVPRGKTGLGTVCSIVINGTLLKAGVPIDSRFGGILQVRNRKPLRFVELIQYSGSSMDPSEIFIRAGMTSVKEVAEKGEGKILANFREIPSICKPVADEILAGLEEAGIHGMMQMGDTSAPVCETGVDVNKIGVILIGGLNPVAAARETGIEAENHAMSTIVDYKELVNIENYC